MIPFKRLYERPEQSIMEFWETTSLSWKSVTPGEYWCGVFGFSVQSLSVQCCLNKLVMQNVVTASEWVRRPTGCFWGVFVVPWSPPATPHKRASHICNNFSETGLFRRSWWPQDTLTYLCQFSFHVPISKDVFTTVILKAQKKSK
jgi:hypothetical protein